MVKIVCTDCGQAYPPTGLPFRCPVCKGIFDYDGPADFALERIEPGLPGYWRYRHAFGLSETAPLISLGEGDTPLVWEDYHGHAVALKLESLNPTGSYKDRGSAVLVSELLARGINEVVEDSSGNAGASFAAYAARAGLACRIFVPEAASGPKRRQIEMYGARLVAVPGPRSEAARAVLDQVNQGAVYASHAYQPFGMAGIATIAYEIWEQCGRKVPGSLIAPVGHGGLLLGLSRGFAALRKVGLTVDQPYFVGVQAAACAPLVRAFHHGLPAMEDVTEEATLAEGVRVRWPVRVKALMAEITPKQGTFLAVSESEISMAYTSLARRGHYVEPTAALGWAALDHLMGRIPEPVVVVLTGLGLKYMPST